MRQGDLEPSLARPDATLDVHMGMVDMRCQDCHATSRHQIAGLSFGAPVTEGRVTCERCHGQTPHGITGYLSRHLDDHVRALACETCHIPSFAKTTPTRLSVDYSVAGQDRPVTLDALGMPTYDKRLGTLTWGKDVVPVYRWFGGTRSAYVIGDRVDPAGTIVLNSPIGEKRDPASRIYPFKIHMSMQPYDTVQNYLVTPRFEGGYWKDFDWQRSITDGMKAVRLKYSGQYGFVKTEMYTSLHHEVAPAQKALGCADCHDSQAITCTRCHKNARDLDQPAHTRKVYPDTPLRLDFKALGYDDDPAKIGGRFYVQLGRGSPPR